MPCPRGSLARVVRLLGLAVLLAATLASCSSSKSSSGASLHLTLSEFKITADSPTVPAGKVSVSAQSKGTIEHELVAFKTDLAETDLPLLADKSRIDEEGAGITHIDPEAEGIKPGSTKTLQLDLAAGRYVFVCNLPLHYGQGMRVVVRAK